MLILLVHLLLMGWTLLAGRKRGVSLDAGRLLFCFLIPVFGPVCGLEMIYAEAPDTSLLRDLVMNQDALHRSHIAPEPAAATTAPMEEAFIISTPQVRREMMMKLLHDDPEENIDLLMMARFNDDPETAHYATAALTEYQRQTEMELQQSQALLSKRPEDTQTRLQYIRQMETYIGSGLLEGHLLKRQRLLMDQELNKLPEEALDLSLGCLQARNLLAMGQVHEAAAAARRLMERFPTAEEPWLELMRVYVDSQNAQGLRELGARVEKAGVLWSFGGREKMEYFMRGVETYHEAE